jgi:hypothetical protein
VQQKLLPLFLFLFLFFGCHSFFFVDTFLPSFDYKGGDEFHLWIPFMESRFGHPMKRVSTKQQQQQQQEQQQQLNSICRYDDSAVLDICTTQELVANRKKEFYPAV